jgi:hypothetical protein
MGPQPLGVVRLGHFKLLQTRNNRSVNDLNDVSFLALVKHTAGISRPIINHRRSTELFLITADQVRKIEIDFVTWTVCYKNDPVPIEDISTNSRNANSYFGRSLNSAAIGSAKFDLYEPEPKPDSAKSGEHERGQEQNSKIENRRFLQLCHIC